MSSEKLNRHADELESRRDTEERQRIIFARTGAISHAREDASQSLAALVG